MLEPGTRAPDFDLPDHTGATVASRDLAEQGRWMVMWWYPKADTPG